MCDKKTCGLGGDPLTKLILREITHTIMGWAASDTRLPKTHKRIKKKFKKFKKDTKKTQKIRLVGGKATCTIQRYLDCSYRMSSKIMSSIRLHLPFALVHDATAQ